MDVRFCTECGSTLNEQGLCTNHTCPQHTPKAHSESKRSPFQSKTYAEKEKKIVPECVDPDTDEIHIKQYDIARLQTLIKGAFAEGRLQVTNKRVLFRSSGSSIFGPTSLQYEFSLEEIAGIEIRKEARFNFFPSILLILFTSIISTFFDPLFAKVYSWGFVSVVFSLLMSAAAVFFFFLFKNRKVLRHLVLSVPFAWYTADMTLTSIFPDNTLINLALWIAWGCWFISLIHLVFAPNLVVYIKSKGGSPSIEIRRKDRLLFSKHNEYTGFAQIFPGPDTDIAMKELGSLIREVQQTGGYTKM